MSEQVVDGLLVGGEIGGNVHVVQYVGRVDGHNCRFNGEKRRRLVDAFDAASLPSTARLRNIGESSVTLRRSGVGTRPNVEYLGRVFETQLVNEYQEATAFVLPSLYEGFGLPAIEAQKSCSRVSSRWGLANASRFSWRTRHSESISIN
ncbi:glycosyltransferase [Mycobacterium sp.]|uniref:glycosyltransferase family 4 protein n=1 Tax=Mycobacterium sp. TaxID=1785 RepID=UPI003F981350